MKTVYLHIGTPKTGTTHLQAYFSHNRTKLLEDGVCYVTDQLGITVQGVALALGFWEDHDPNAYHEDLNWFRTELKAALASPAQSIVLSTEMFCEALAYRREALIRRLHTLLKSCGAERIVVVCYVRRQDLFTESRQANDIGRWGISPPVSDIDPESIVNYADYYQLLSEYRKVFGKEIIVRPFEKQQLVNGDVLDDFLSVIGLARNPEYTLPSGSEHNMRLRGDVLEMVRLYNLSKLGEDNDYGLVPLRFLPAVFSAAQLGSGPGKRFLTLSKAKRTEILKRYAPGNRKVALEFLGRKDGKLFRDPVISTPSDPNNGLGLQLEEITPIFMHMFIQLFARSEPWVERLAALETRAHGAVERMNGLEGSLRAIDARHNQQAQGARARVEHHENRVVHLEGQLRDAHERCARLEKEQRELRWMLACQAVEGKKLVGWGTSSAFRAGFFTKPAPLAYVIDNDAKKWGRKIKGITIEHPGKLEKEHPSEVVVIVYSSSFAEISAQIAKYGNFTVIPAESFGKYAVLPEGRSAGGTRRAGALALAG